jgi:transposase
MAAARYRERATTARSKSDAVDALMLANVLRTDRHQHRPMPADSDLVRAVGILARAGQDATWARQQVSNQLRSVLREFYPAALEAFQVKHIGLASVEARAVLGAAPTPTAAAKLSKARLTTLLKRAGRQRNLQPWADRLHTIFTTVHLQHPPIIEAAFGQQVHALLLQLDAACHAVDQLLQAAEDAFRQHPDATIITSFPGLGATTGARVLAEIGDDRQRFEDPRALKAYAGAAPVTRASGKVHLVMHRRVKNDRLAAAGYSWTFAALTASPGARAHYDRRRQAGDRHNAALRNLYNRYLGQLHHCLQTGQLYDENQAFKPTPISPAAVAA